MIQWMHALSKSWVATLLMGALALSFVVWGIADVFQGGSAAAVATVGSTSISQQDFVAFYHNMIRNRSQQMGMQITPDMAEKMGLSQTALQQIISRAAIDNETGRLGLVTPDSAVVDNVHAIAAFKGPTGSFNHQTFLQVIQTAGYSEDQFLAEIRGQMTRDQLAGAVESNYVVPPAYAQALFLYINERRAVEYVILSPEGAGAIAPPSDAVLAAYVRDHATQFSTPEYRDADYAELTPADVMGQVNVTDAMVQQQYDAQKSTYVIPEKRDVVQMEFKTEAEATAARAKIAGGTAFEALATQRGLKPADISLGTLTQDQLPDPDRAKAIFALAMNDTSQPVKTLTGSWALVKVGRIEAGTNRSFDQVKDDIRKDLITRSAQSKLIDAANAFQDARNSGDDLAAAAKKAGMHVAHVKAVDATGMAPDGTHGTAPADPEFLSALFKAEEGEDNDPFNTQAGNLFAITVKGVTPPKLKSLAQVHDQAVAAWTAGQSARILSVKAQALAAQATKDKSLDGIAKSLGVSVQHSPALTRATNDTMFSASLVQDIFKAQPGGVVAGAQGSSGNFVIARITGIAHPPLNPRDPGLGQGMAQLSQGIAGDFTVAMANAARARHGVKVYPASVTAALGAGG